MRLVADYHIIYCAFRNNIIITGQSATTNFLVYLSKIFHSHHPDLVARYPKHPFRDYVCGPVLFDDVDWREVPPLGEQADPFCANNFVFPLSSRLYTANSIPIQLTFRSSMALSQPSRCRRSSGVERTLGKGEAVSSILTGGTIYIRRKNSTHCVLPAQRQRLSC